MRTPVELTFETVDEYIESRSPKEDGWDSYGAVATRREAKEKMAVIVRALLSVGVRPADIFVVPTVSGGLQLEELEIEI